MSEAQRGKVYDRSGTIAVGGTAQDAVGVNEARKWLFVQNPADAAEVLYVNIGADASTAGKVSIELAAGGSLSLEGTFCPVDRVSVTAATLGHAFICKEGK